MGAAGGAFGPLMAALANDMDMKMGLVLFNGMTNPGWIMFICWVVLGGVTQVFFKVSLRSQ